MRKNDLTKKTEKFRFVNLDKQIDWMDNEQSPPTNQLEIQVSNLIAQLNTILTEIVEYLHESKGGELNIDIIASLIGNTSLIIHPKRIGAIQLDSVWRIIIVLDNFISSFESTPPECVAVINDNRSVELVEWETLRSRLEWNVKPDTAFSGDLWGFWLKYGDPPPLNFDSDSWVGTYQDVAFGDTSWILSLNGEPCSFQLNAATLRYGSKSQLKSGEWLSIECEGSSMSTGDIGYTVSVDEGGGVWVDLWGYQTHYLGQQKSESPDPISALESCLDGADISQIIFLYSETLTSNEILHLLPHLEELDVNFDIDQIVIQCKDYDGPALELPEIGKTSLGKKNIDQSLSRPDIGSTKLENEISDSDNALIPTITLLNTIKNHQRAFSLDGFNPKTINSIDDLPPYLIMGALEENSFKKKDENWSARWQGTDPDSYLSIKFDLKRSQYSITQCWHGINGGISMYRDHIPLSVILGQILNREFPMKWDEQAAVEFSTKYKLAYLPRMKSVPNFFGIPDGFFSVIAIPVHVLALRGVIEILSSLCCDVNFTSPIQVQAHRTFQTIYYIEGKAPEATMDPTNLFVPSFFETGFLPITMPNREVSLDGTAAWTVRRLTYVVCIQIPFSMLDFCLAWLNQNSNLIQSQEQHKGENHVFSMQPFLMPSGIDALGGEVSFTDAECSTRLVWNFRDAKFNSESQIGMAKPFDTLERERVLQSLEMASKNQEDIIDAAIKGHETPEENQK